MLAALPVWIGPPGGALDRAEVTFSSTLDLSRRADRALVRVLAQQRFALAVDGKPVALGDEATPWVFDLGGGLAPGKHRIDVTVQSDAVPSPDNAWVVLRHDLGKPTAADRLVLETADARQDEWLYVEVIDDQGRGSGYYCAERGHPDLRLGASGERRRHVIDLRADDTLNYRAFGPCDFSRLRYVQVRVDQKTTSTRPVGGLAFHTVRLEGARALDLGNPAAWAVTQGAGDHRRAALSPSGAGFALALDFRPAADVRVALDLRAFAGDEEVGRLVSGPEWQSDAGGVMAVPRGRGPGGQHTEYWPADIRDAREVGAPPIRALAELSVNGGVDRVQAGTPLDVSLRLRALVPHPQARAVRVRVTAWSGEVVAEARLPIAWSGQTGAGTAALQGLPRGLYTVEADLGTRARSPRRGVALAVLGPGETRVSAVFDTLGPFALPCRGLQGVDLSYRDSPALLMGVRALGVNFLQFHLEPGQIDSGGLDELVAFCLATRTRFALNNETGNWSPSARRPDGSERFSAPSGCHRWDIERAALGKAAATGLFEGVVYDEGEHMQLCRNAYSGLPDSARRKPYLVETTGLDLPAAYDALLNAAARVAAYNEAAGGRMLVESVFPVLWHPLARAGVTLAPKLLKEDVHPVVLAQALGAARQYGVDLWFSPDLWHMDQLPGHSVREYRAALRLAHAAGVDNVYTEFATCLAMDYGPAFSVTPYGEELRRHIERYLPARPRGYTHRDYRPEVAVVRFPDSDWGQASCSYWDTLYGAEDLKSTPETREWLVVWSLLTRGGTHPGAVNANSGVYDRFQWRFGVPSPSVAVYDHLVTAECLEGVRRIWLCGTRIAPQGLQAVRDAVRRGATCVAAQRLCPPDVVLAAASSGRCRDGRGTWVVVPAFTPAMEPPLRPDPLPHGMRLRFGRRTVTVTDP